MSAPLSTPPGWYSDTDPMSPVGAMRWWDGTAWTDHLHQPALDTPAITEDTSSPRSVSIGPTISTGPTMPTGTTIPTPAGLFGETVHPPAGRRPRRTLAVAVTVFVVLVIVLGAGRFVTHRPVHLAVSDARDALPADAQIGEVFGRDMAPAKRDTKNASSVTQPTPMDPKDCEGMVAPPTDGIEGGATLTAKGRTTTSSVEVTIGINEAEARASAFTATVGQDLTLMAGCLSRLYPGADVTTGALDDGGAWLWGEDGNNANGIATAYNGNAWILVEVSGARDAVDAGQLRRLTAIARDNVAHPPPR